MEQQNTAQTQQKLSIFGWIKKYLNYPMLLLTLALLMNIQNVFSTVIRFFTVLLRNPLNIADILLSLTATLAPVALLVLLALDRLGKLPNTRKWIGISCVAGAAAKAFTSIRVFKMLIPLLGTDFYTMYNPLVQSLEAIFEILSYALLAVAVLKNPPDSWRSVQSACSGSAYFCFSVFSIPFWVEED